MKTPSPLRCLPDTNVVIGRARKRDLRHKAAVRALGHRVIDDIRILRTVYIESGYVVSKKNQEALRAIHGAMHKIAASIGVAPQFINGSHFDQIIKEARSNVDNDIVTYFEAIESMMKLMIKRGVNPFASMGYVGDSVTQQDRRSISDIFLVDSVDDCIGCENGRQLKMMGEIEGHLRSSNPFFTMVKIAKTAKSPRKRWS
jgi:hypothetical protein